MNLNPAGVLNPFLHRDRLAFAGVHREDIEKWILGKAYTAVSIRG
jgi:hypothetical protein